VLIGYVGNFKPPHSTETHLARTLEQMGHQVARLQEDDLTPDALTRALDRLDLGLFLFTRTWGQTVTMGHLETLRKRGVPTVSYHLDLYVPLQRNGGIDTDPFWRTDVVFTPDGDPRSAAEFERRGINHRWMLPAVVADECYLAAGVEPSRDVIFVGSGPGYHPEWPYRGELLDWLTATYRGRFTQHGGRGQAVRGHELNALYAGTKVAVGDALVLERDDIRWRSYTSDRRYEAPGRGACQIFPRIEGLGDGFEDGVTIVEYDFGDWAGLRDRIDYYLAHDDEREKIRRAGHEHVKANHTYTQRLTQALDILRAEGVIS
jgi:hypothetical protein